MEEDITGEETSDEYIETESENIEHVYLLTESEMDWIRRGWTPVFTEDRVLSYFTLSDRTYKQPPVPDPTKELLFGLFKNPFRRRKPKGEKHEV